MIILIGYQQGYLQSAIPMSTYSSAYEGARTMFYGVRDWESSGRIYTSTQKGSASLATFDTTMKFDRDEFYTLFCNVHGEMTAVQVPLGANNWVPPSWVPQEWWTDAANWANPKNTYTWQLKVGDTYYAYEMEEWLTKWFISISAEFDSGPNPLDGADEAQSRRYKNLEVWCQFDISPNWYFEGQATPYFAIAKIQLSSIKIEGKDLAIIRIDPQSPGSILTIYTIPFGATVAPSDSDITNFYYRNVTLNPFYFTDKVYCYINLADFGTQEWFDWNWYARGDVVTLGFTVTQFVVGEWKVQDIDDIPDDYGRTSKYGLWGIFPDWLNPLLDAWNTFWGNPFNLGLGIGAVVLVVVVVFVIVMLWWGIKFPFLRKWRKQSD
jgi:hypothetical protein